MDKTLITLLIILNLSACGSESDTQSELVGSFQRNNQPFQDWTADHTWHFASDGTFSINSLLYNAEQAGTINAIFEGTYSLGASTMTASGQSAMELNLTYIGVGAGTEASSDVYTQHSSDVEPVYELAYLQDNNLYFGIRDTYTTEYCSASDLNLLGETDQSDFLAQYGNSNTIEPLDLSNCHIRPSELDFENVLFKVE